ncbi:NINE protein [Synechococcus sp. CBW1006]|uniref:NINE protein n=1 Tax=Synechococcus sp. CBW1006 TaxID=1353138 RepID=UPI0018CDE26E|nr:NINE protein [Synechococcus sp. CBW1006]QPN66092.1 NINE protein [Synechococcus sp. CBW1006]
MPSLSPVLPPERRHVAVGYVLWALGLIGVCGLQRFYTRRPVSGTLWLLTLGCCGIGQLVDLFLMPELVRTANQPLALHEALAAADAEKTPSLQRQLLVLARQAGTKGFTINDAMLALELGRDDDVTTVRQEIDQLMGEHLLDVGNDERGRVVYREF